MKGRLIVIVVFAVIVNIMSSSELVAQVSGNESQKKNYPKQRNDSTKTSQKLNNESKGRSLMFNNILFDTIHLNSLPRLFVELNQIEFISCRVNFAGTGFPNVIQAIFRGKPKNLFERQSFHVGSKIVFSEFVIKQTDGTPSRIMKKAFYIK